MTAPLPSESDQAAARPANRPAPLPQFSIDQDLPCTRCGYNLRGLLAEHCCPECGTPVARSAGGDRLAAADPDWLRRVCRGQTCICAACLAALCAAISFTLLSAQVSGLRVPGGFGLWAVLFGGSVLVSLLLLLVGIFVITAFEPRKTLSEQPVSLRRFVRGAATVAVAAVPLRWLTVTGLALVAQFRG